VLTDRWFGGFSPTVAGGNIWIELDMPALGDVVVQVLYGYLHAPYWVNVTEGPIFDRGESTNDVWAYIGAFGDPLGQPSTHSWKWLPTTAAGIGMRAIQAHLGDPWTTSTQELTAVNATGGEVPSAAQIQGYAGSALHHPLQITQVVHSGYTKQDPALEKLVLRVRDELTNTQEDVWDMSIAIDTVIGTDTETVINTVGDHGLSDGDTVYIEGITLSDPAYSGLNGASYTVITDGLDPGQFNVAFVMPDTVTGTSGKAWKNTTSGLEAYDEITTVLDGSREAVTFALRHLFCRYFRCFSLLCH
jgi:hypothetical protein